MNIASTYKTFKACTRFVILTFFSFKKFSLFFISLHKELSEPTFSACLIVLDNLYEVFGCSVIINSISTMFDFSKSFQNIWFLLMSNYFCWFCVFLSYKWSIVFFCTARIRCSCIYLFTSKNIFFSFIIVFKDKVFDWHLFLQLWRYLRYTLLYIPKQQK